MYDVTSNRRKAWLGALGAFAVVLAGCAEQDEILPGERLNIRGEPIVEVLEGFEAVPIALPAAQPNADWTHRNGGPTHQINHPALGAVLQPFFTTDIGAGNSRRARITADPVVGGGIIYTMDARSQVVATSLNGEPLWAQELIPPLDGRTDASGGGLALGGGVLLVTTGFGELIALDPASGAVLWRQDLDAPGTAAPTVANGLAYVVGRDGQAWAIDLATGRIRWTLGGAPSISNFSGGAGAAVTADIAVLPFPNGEIRAAFPEGGLQRWSTVVTGQRPGQAGSTVSDIAGDPVIVGDRIYVGNVSGRVVALGLANGDRIWTATEGAVGPVWPAGGSVFLVNDLSELIRLDDDTGAVVWRVALPGFEENRERRQKTRFAHYGPILAGNRLIVASSDGLLRQFDPASGALLGTLEVPGGAASNPVVAGQTLYVVSQRGELLAFR